MGFEFDESEMYPCDICGEFWPMGEMHELEDGRIVYRNGKKVLILAGKAAPKVLIEDRLADLIGAQTKQGISLDDVIPQTVVCSQELRAFFVENIGKGFHFKAEFQDWLHNNAGKTFRDAVSAYHSIEHPKEIKPQFEYNQYIRDFFADNKGTSLKDAIRCWHWKKLQPGSHRYEKSDLLLASRIL